MIVEIKNNSDLNKYKSDITKLKKVCIDTETTGLDPLRDKPVLFQIGDEKTQYIIHWYNTDISSLKDYLTDKEVVKVFHHHKFDYKFIKVHAGISVDTNTKCTALAELMIYGGIKKDFKRVASMAYCAKKYLDMDLEKSSRDFFIGWNKRMGMPRRQIEYAANDVITPLKIFKQQEEIISREGMDFAYKLENSVSSTLGDIELNGMFLDRELWSKLSGEMLIEHTKSKDQIEKILSPFVQIDLFGKPIINISSHQQLLLAVNKLIKEKLKGEKLLEGTSEGILQRYKGLHDIFELLLDYRTREKALTTYGESFYKHINPNTNRIHPNYFPIVSTGRLSCIAEDTIITCVESDKKIQDMKIGDLVYCYDDNGKLRISKVKRVIYNGIQECDKIQWQSTGTGRIGNLICTSDHTIKTKYKGWVRTDNLLRYDKLIHLNRKKQKNGRITLYGPNCLQESEQAVIKREYFHADSSMHLHHINHIKDDNRISNLKVMTRSDHCRLHGILSHKEGKLKYKHLATWKREYKKGTEHHNYIQTTKEELNKLIHKHKGNISSIPMDFYTFKKKCKDISFDYKKIASLYYNKYIELTVEGVIESMKKNKGVLYKVRQDLGVGFIALRKFCLKNNIEYNHTVTSATECGKYRVYDLEIEDHHNFIANEICVHNCENPNLQNIKAPKKPGDLNYREPFTAEDIFGGILTSDYSGCELRILAELSGDQYLVDAFSSEWETGEEADIHSIVATLLYGVEVSKTINPDKRKAAKNINFGLIYGMGVVRLARTLGISIVEAKSLMKQYFKTFSDIERYLTRSAKQALEEGFSVTLSGRKRYFNVPSFSEFRDTFLTSNPKAKPNEIRESYQGLISHIENQGKNTPIQGTNGDIVKLALVLLRKDIKENNRPVRMINTVHDEIVFESNDYDYLKDEYKFIAEKKMLEAQEFFVKSVPPRVSSDVDKSWTK